MTSKWVNSCYIVDEKVIGRIWGREDKFWKWGYTGGFIETEKEAAKKQVERMAKKEK